MFLLQENQDKIDWLKPICFYAFLWYKWGVPEFGLLTQGKFPVAQWSAGLGSGEDLECMEEA